MELDLDARTCLVTGASTGIGRGTARLLAAEGARLALTARRGALLAELAGEIEQAGGAPPVVIAADLAAEDGPERIAEAVAKAFGGGVDILINNAGASRPVPLDAAADLWHTSWQLNFEQQRQLTMRLLPHMTAQGWGRIVNVTGSSEPRSLNAAIPAKAAVLAWSKGLACEVGPHGVTVNCVAPGRIHSEQIDQRLYPDAAAQEAFAKANIPVGYFGEPEDMGHLIAFLASPLARYITGELIHVDGGLRRFAF